MKIYNYDPTTCAFTGESSARLDPAESARQKKDVFLIPAAATSIAPPAAVSGKVPVFDLIAGAWSMVEDHRGTTVYDTSTGHPSLIDQPGPIPSGKTLLAPQPMQVWDTATKAWVDDVSKQIKDALRKRQSIMDGYDAEIAWRESRLARDTRLGRALVETRADIDARIAVIDAYMAHLADITAQQGFPAIIDWGTPV